MNTTHDTGRTTANSGLPNKPQGDKRPKITHYMDSGPETEATTNDPFDPARYRLTQNPADALGVKKVITTVPCRKPHRQEWFRVHPDDDHRLEALVYEDKIERENYLVDPDVVPELGGELHPVCIYQAISRQGDSFLLPVKMPGLDGRDNNWNASKREAVQLALTTWIRLVANMGAGYYDVLEATNIKLPEPQWPNLSFQDLLRICFKEHLIDSPDHIVVKQLRGEV